MSGQPVTGQLRAAGEREPCELEWGLGSWNCMANFASGKPRVTGRCDGRRETVESDERTCGKRSLKWCGDCYDWGSFLCGM